MAWWEILLAIAATAGLFGCALWPYIEDLDLIRWVRRKEAERLLQDRDRVRAVYDAAAELHRREGGLRAAEDIVRFGSALPAAQLFFSESFYDSFRQLKTAFSAHRAELLRQGTDEWNPENERELAERIARLSRELDARFAHEMA